MGTGGYELGRCCMRYKNLGRTGLQISALGLGCANFGGIGSDPALFGKVGTREEAFAVMDRAWASGINYFDTANSYGGGLSESYIGEWIKRKGADVRGRLILSTKVCSPVGDGPIYNWLPGSADQPGFSGRPGNGVCS